MSSLHGGHEIHRSGTGTLTIGKEIGYEELPIAQMDFDRGQKDVRVLFINPPVDFSVFYSDMDLSDTKSSSPPIGILHLAAMARDYGYGVKLVDAHAEGLSLPQLLKVVAEFQPQVVCLTAMTIMIEASALLAKEIKSFFPDIVTMIGGVHLTAEPTKTLEQYPQFDFGVVGEGELVLIDFLDAWQQKRPFESVQSLVWRAEDRIVTNPRRSFFKNLDEFPFPAFDLVGDKLFSHYRLSVFGTKQFRSVGLVTSRGCTGMCVTGDSLVLTKDLRWVRIDSIKIGDEICGVEEFPSRGSYRHFVTGVVTHCFPTREEPVYRIVTEDGRITATADHPWLTYHNRWRTTSQLRPGWAIRFLCPAEESLPETIDYKQGYLCGALKGDGYVKRPHIRLVGDHEMMDMAIQYSESLNVPLHKRPFNGGMYKRISYCAIRSTQAIYDEITGWFSSTSPEYERGFLAGFFDADGSWTSALKFHGKNQQLMEYALLLLHKHGFQSVLHRQPTGAYYINLTNGDGEAVRFLGWCQPKVQRKWKRWNKGLTLKGQSKILSVTPAGTQPVYNIETSVKTYIANGYVNHNCTFCDLGVVGRGYRFMSSEYLINHLKELNERYQVNDLLFYDDMFTGNRKRLETFCHAMIDAGKPFTWSCCSRVDFVNYMGCLELMREAGCHTIEFGVESGCQRILDSMRKNVTKEKIAEVISKTTNAGITTKANFILGHLGETHDSIMETIDFASKLNVDYVQHTHLVPLPGSEIYESAGKHGTFDPSWSKMNTLLINFIPFGFTRQDLVWYSKYFWRKFYLKPRVIWAEVKKIHSWEGVYRLWLAVKSFLKVTLLRKNTLRTHSGKVGLIH